MDTKSSCLVLKSLWVTLGRLALQDLGLCRLLYSTVLVPWTGLKKLRLLSSVSVKKSLPVSYVVLWLWYFIVAYVDKRHVILFVSGKYIQGEDVTKLASMCKLKAGRLSREVTDSCLQYWGGMGYTNETFVSRMYRWDFAAVYHPQ